MLAVALYDVQASHLITAGSVPNVDFGLVNQALFGERREMQIFQRKIHGFEEHECNRRRSDERESKRPFPPSHHPPPRRACGELNARYCRGLGLIVHETII